MDASQLWIRLNRIMKVACSWRLLWKMILGKTWECCDNPVIVSFHIGRSRAIMTNILIAGIGNIFFGDDAFGVEVAQRLLTRELPPAVTVVDFGIRGFDLAYAMMD